MNNLRNLFLGSIVALGLAGGMACRLGERSSAVSESRDAYTVAHAETVGKEHDPDVWEVSRGCATTFPASPP